MRDEIKGKIMTLGLNWMIVIKFSV